MIRFGLENIGDMENINTKVARTGWFKQFSIPVTCLTIGLYAQNAYDSVSFRIARGKKGTGRENCY